jgi:endonuclease YncB( thermonuclease family)
VRRIGAKTILGAAILLFLGRPAGADVISGNAAVLDGTTIEIDGKRIRLFGIAAPGLAQQCVRTTGGAERPYPCGLDAKAYLASLLSHRTVFCVPESEMPEIATTVAQCFANGADVSESLVLAGWAVAADRVANIYVGAEEAARQAQRGLWVGRFDRPQSGQ